MQHKRKELSVSHLSLSFAASVKFVISLVPLTAFFNFCQFFKNVSSVTKSM
jgi:hypothetical protein